MEKSIKIKDLPKGTNMGSVRVKTPDGTEGWWVSQWPKGVWIRKEIGEGQVYPVFVEDLMECMEWDVLEVKE